MAFHRHSNPSHVLSARTFATEAPPSSEAVAASQNAEQLDETSLSQLTEEQYAAAVEHGRALFEPVYHPRTHGIPAALIHLRSHHVSFLQLFTHFVTHTAAALAIPISKPVPLPTQRSLWTVVRGPFVHKKSQENFDRLTHKRVIKAWDTDPEVVERWVRYLERHALPGVGMRVVRWERAPVGVGKKVAETVQAAMQGTKTEEKVKKLGEKIVKQELSSAKPIPEVDSPKATSSP